MTYFKKLACVGELLEEGLKRYPQNIAFIEVNRDKETARLTYEYFRSQALKLANQIHLDVTPGSHGAILMSNQSRWPLCATAIFWCGGIVVPLDYKLTPKEQRALLAHSESKILFIEWPIYERWIKEGIDFPSNLRVIVSEVPSVFPTAKRFEGSTRAPVIDHDRWEQLFETNDSNEPMFKKVNRSREDIACIVYSSGTGGTPKGCMLTHGNYLAQAEVLAKMFPIKPNDRYFSVLPTNHAIDFMCGFLLPLQFGSAVVHQRTLRPEFLAATMKTYGISHMALVPLLLKAFENKIRGEIDQKSKLVQKILYALMKFNRLITYRKPWYAFSKILFRPIHSAFGGRLRLMFAGGAFVDARTAEFFYALGLPVAIGYGLTESGTVLTVNNIHPFRADTVGQPIEGVALEIKNPDRAGIGEVWVKGPTLMKGYFKEPELTQEVLLGGWLKTGDIGQVDSTGHLKLFGRSKNMIVTEGGKNIYPEDVEALFGSIDQVEELCVFSTSFVWPGTDLKKEKLFMVVRSKSGEQDKNL
ncbi:MAG: AMP-binding protein, partial [Bdellovibrionales bacterium]|nr:AMP-binding protein [Bdellovibrionales bacterium]